MRPWLAAALVLVAAMPLASAAASHVHIQGFAFNPKPVTIAEGETVVWDNHDSAPHTVTSTDSKFQGSGTLGTGDSFSFTFTAAGTYAYRCNIHQGMTASVIVQAASPANEAPTVAITAPAEGAKVNGTATVSGTAADADGDLLTVEVRVDAGPWQLASGAGTWTFPWNTTLAANGTHVLRARVTDGKATVESAPRNVTVANAKAPPPAPILSLTGFTAPLAADVGDVVPVNVTARNAGTGPGTANVRFFVDGVQKHARSVEVQPGGAVNVAFSFTADAAGSRAVAVALNDAEALPARFVTVAAAGTSGGDDGPASGDKGTPAAGALALLALAGLAAASRRR